MTIKNESDVHNLWVKVSRTRCAYLVPFPETATDCQTATVLPNALYPSSGGWSTRIRQLNDGDFIWIEAHSNNSLQLFSYDTSTHPNLRKVSINTLKMLITPFLTAHCHWVFHVCDSYNFAKAFKMQMASSNASPLSVVAGMGLVRPDDFPKSLYWVP